jgi:hypothetical protein
MLAARFARRLSLKPIQRGADLLQEPLDFLTLIWAAIVLQPLEQLSLSRKKAGNGRHLLIRTEANALRSGSAPALALLVGLEYSVHTRHWSVPWQ